MASLDEPLLKLARARKHSGELRDVIEPLLQPHLYSVTNDYDQETGKHSFRLDSEVPIIPAEVGVIIGDILFNFRCVLDYLICQLVLANGGNPKYENAFPICEKESQFESNKTAKKLRGVSDTAKDVIKDLQPCYGGDLPLARLVTLRNVDTHRQLNVAVASVNHADVYFSSPDENFACTPYIGLIEKGTVLLTVIRPYDDVRFAPEFEVAIIYKSGTEDSQINVLEGMARIDYSVNNVIDALRSHLP